MRLLFIVFALSTSLPAQMPYGYEWMNRAPNPQVIQQSAASGSSPASHKAENAWRLSVGYAVRSFAADFRMNAPDIGLIGPSLSGLGNVGFYHNGAGILHYEDGYVGPDNGNGTAWGEVTSRWRTPEDGPLVWDTSFSGVIKVIGPGVDDRSTETFHTKSFAMPNQADDATGHALGYGPYVRFSKTIFENAFGSVGFSATWTHLHGLLDASMNFGHPTRTDFLYTYDRAGFIEPLPKASFGVFGIVINADTVNELHEQAFGTPGYFRNPRQSTQQFRLTDWTALGRNDLDVRLDELFLSLAATGKPWRGWEFGLSAGPTLNVVSSTLNSHTYWVHSDGRTVPGPSTRQSSTHGAVGVGMQGSVRHDLTRDGRAFIEAHAGYKWLNDLAISGPASSANLDLSDWEVGLGVGVRLDDWPAGSPWSLHAGINTRTLSFTAGTANRSALQSRFNRTGGRGDVGFFDGKHTARYNDGFIVGNTWATPQVVPIQAGGFDTFSIDHPQQANLYTNDSGGIPITTGNIAFHSTGFRESIRDVASTKALEREMSVGPFVELSRPIASLGPLSVGVCWGWETTAQTVQIDPIKTAHLTARRENVLFTYSYPYFRAFEVGPTENSSYPFSNDSLLADPRRFSNDWPKDTRSKSSSATSSSVHYYALTSASVEVTMQTLSCATDLAWKPLKRLELALSAGPTLNIVCTSTDLTTHWVHDNGALFARLQNHDDKTQCRLGLRLLASARYDLDHDGRWFLEVRGGYEWMQDVDLGIGLQAAKLDATSWQVGGSIGCRLGVKTRLTEMRNLTLKPNDRPS